MSHACHDSLPGYSPNQILHDGCQECEERGANVRIALAHLDSDKFVHAWARAAAWQRSGINDLSQAERPLLEALWGVQVQLEDVCSLPIGTLPRVGPLHQWSKA